MFVSKWISKIAICEPCVNYLSVLPVKILPDEVHPVDVSVMQIEAGLKCREVEVTTRITANSEMPTAMYRNAGLHGGPDTPITLHDGLERLDVVAVEDRVRGVLQRGPLAADVRVEISLDTSWVVLERVGRADGADVDRVVGKGCPLFKAASTAAGLCTTH